MVERIFTDLVQEQNSKQKHLCVGLDTDIDRVLKISNKALPNLSPTSTKGEFVLAYNKMVIEATSEFAGAYKPNRAFYAKLGNEYIPTLRETIRLAQQINPGALVILDAKYGDIDNSNEGYVEEAYGVFNADAVTLHPYMGLEAYKPFLDLKTKGSFILVKTSNKGGDQFQGINIGGIPTFPPVPLYSRVAKEVANEWKINKNVAVVAGATYPDEAEKIRKIVGPEMAILFPGVGDQGGSAASIVRAALKTGELGFINASRSVIFATPKELETQAQAIHREAQALHWEMVVEKERL